MQVSLINLNLVAQDAVGTCIVNQARFFLRRGDDVHIYLCHPPVGVPNDIAGLTFAVSLADLVGGRLPHFRRSDLFIYHYPSRHPLMESIKGIERGAVIFYYHNVTPPELWGASVESSLGDRAVLARGAEGIALVHYADLAIADSPFNADELVERAGFERGRVHVLPLAVPLDQFAPGPKDVEILRRYNLEGQRVLMFVGRMAGNKRIDLLVEALAHVKGRVPNVKLLLVGDCDAATAYREVSDRARAQAVELGVADAVIFTGRVDDLPRHYHAADVYVTASLHEGFGVPLIEAMASGVPVVASKAGAMPWVLGEAGRLCEPGNARDLADKILVLLQDDAQHGDLVRRGLERARDFSLERYEADLWSIVSKLTHPIPGLRLTDLEPVGAPQADRAKAEVLLSADVNALDMFADVALQGYVVRSKVPLVGPFIAWLRRNLTSHLREPYLDPIIERQVVFNRRVAELLERMTDIGSALLRQETDSLTRRMDAVEARQTMVEASLGGASDLEARLRLVEARLDLLSAQVSLLEAERSAQANDPRLENLRQQIEALRVSLSK